MTRLIITLLACILAGTTMGASSCSTETTDKPDASGGDGKSKTPTAHLGDAITLKGNDTDMKVTVLRVIDPLGGGQFDQPSSGRRFIGVKVKLRNVGGKTYDDSPSNGAKLIDNHDEQADDALLTGGDCGTSFGSDTTISPGTQQQGCLAFEIKKRAKPKTFQFGLDSGFGPQTGEWALR